MEGEKILKELKTSNSLIKVTRDVKKYLSPVLKKSQPSEKPKDPSKFGKYEIFSLKLLKQCIEQCKGDVEDDSISLLQIGAISVESLEFCNRCSGKVPPLSFEKLLFHFASQCFNCAQYDVGLKASDVLCSQLRMPSDRVRNVHSLEKEGCDLLKHTFDLLWKVAVKIEQGDGSSLDSNTIDLCLEIRRRAFVCLLSTDFELLFALDRILKSDSRYQKLSSGIGVSPFDHLYEFHVSILKEKDLLGCFDAGSSCTWFAPMVEYTLHLAKICVHSGHNADGREYVQRAQTLCHQHCKVCLHPLTSLHVQIVELFITFCDLDVCMSESHHETNFPEEVLHLLRTISAGLKMSVKGSSFEASSLTKVIYSLETLVSCLEGKREQFIKRVPHRECSFIPILAFPPLRGVFMGYVECVEVHLKLQQLADSTKDTLLEKNARSRQLSVLSFLARILLDLLMVEDEEDSGDEIEILRSSSAPHTLVPPPPPDPKKRLADCCLPLLQRSRQVIERASEGLLPCTEHKWLGNNAYNLGLALFRSELFSEASRVLELACDELVKWCDEGRGEKERARRSEEAQLLSKFTLLYDSHRKASCYTTAMETVEKAITSLPANQISSDNCKRVLVGQWVKAKRDLTTELVGVDEEFCHRTTADVLRKRESATDDTLVSYLEEELRKYKGQSHDTLLDQLAVAHSLLGLYSRAEEEEEGGCGTVVDRARLTIEVATLRRSCRDHTMEEEEEEESSPLALLDKAVSFLEPLTCDTSPHTEHHLCQAHEQLATAHLWRAICASEQLIDSCEPTNLTALPDTNEGDIPANKPGVEVCLSKEEEQQMMAEDTVSCLYAAVECWVEMWEVGRGESDSERCFCDLPSAFQHLHLTSTLCLTHNQPLLALKSLSVMMAIYHCNPLPRLKAFYQSALAQYCELALSFGGGEGMEGSLRMCGDSSQSQLSGKSQMELQASFVECQLALARVKLQNEQFEECRQVLLSVIQHPLLHRRSTLSHSLTARAKLLTARYLQHRKFELKPSQDFLHYLLSEPCEGFDSKPFTLTPLELATDALKVYQNLADHHNIMSKPDAHVSRDASVQGGQDILWGLLCALKEVTRVYLDQGGMREAYYYAREGAMLSRTVLLQGWYVEFLLLMAEVQLTRGQHDSAQMLLQQAGRLTELEDYLSYCARPSQTTPSLTTPTHPSSHTVHDDSVELELEEFGRLSIATPPRGKQKEPLHHPTTCMCTLCTNPVTLLQLTTLLRLWSDLCREEVGEVKGCPEEAVTLLSDAVELVEECSVKCNTVLQSISSRPKMLHFTGSSAYIFILLQLSLSQAQTQLQLDNASKALGICEQATKGLSSAHVPTSSPEFAKLCAWLHLTMGVALVQDFDESKGKRRGRVAKGKKKRHGEAGREPIEKSLSHFLMSYQLCYPTASSLLLRDTCQWLCVSLGSTHVNLAYHFLSLSSQVTLSHQAVYTVGKKWRKHHMTPQSPLEDMLHVLTPPLPPPSPPPLLVFRTILQPPSSPPPLSHTQHLLASLPDSWTVCNLCLAPTTPARKQYHLMLAQAGAGKECVVIKTPLADISPLEEFQAILDSSEQSMTIREKRAWWAARRKLDKRMEELVYQLRTQWLQEWENLLSASSESSLSSSSSFLVLVLGPKVQGLPWEGLLTAQSVSRMPSLHFMAAHKCMLGHRGSVEVDPRHTFYVLNPRGDLPNTEKMFAKWFASQRGWRGVVGRAPTTQEYTTALEEHELFVYCGHGTGRDYLHLDSFQLLSCRASTLLMGCSSGRLTVGGRGDPMGMALNYLISGCPALVANLWDVTDADIDRFCQSLLKSWVQDPTQLSLLDCITKSRAACKLRWLIGASPVVYGVPVLLFA